ncbi:MAG: hypothetical protein QXP60_05640 [Nitrososphaerota archaeon]
MEVLKIYTINGKELRPEATIDYYRLGDKEFPVIKVGEEGRNRKVGLVPIKLKSQTESIKYAIEDNNWLIEASENDGEISKEKIICVFRTQIGFRGSNAHTGDCIGLDEKGDKVFAKFPAIKILAHGIIAQGMAGYMGSGDQFVAIMPANTVFRTRLYGRTYGEPKAHYYCYKDGELLVATLEERELFKIF